MTKDRINVIIPAFRAHGTMFRALSSIVCQTVVDDVSVTIVNDCCPAGDYKNFIEDFSPYMDIREIRLAENSGPGAARQAGIDATDGEFIAFLDADDTFLTVTALETLRREIQTDKTYMCASASFISPKETDKIGTDKRSHMMVYVFGKMYRRSFLDKYQIRFTATRANEDSGFNRTVLMLCDNPEEQIRYVGENVYYYRTDNAKSITRINGELYYFDQCCPGAVDNMISAIEHVKQYKPFSALVLEDTIGFLMHMYANYNAVLDAAPVFAPQLWEYIKKFYHTCYKPIEGYITDRALKSSYTRAMITCMRNGELAGIIPSISVKDFMAALKREPYDPHLIEEIRAEMWEDPKTRPYMEKNVESGGIRREEK